MWMRYIRPTVNFLIYGNQVSAYSSGCKWQPTVNEEVYYYCPVTEGRRGAVVDAWAVR